MVLGWLIHKSLNFSLRMREIDQQTNFISRSLQIVQQLRFMNLLQLINGLEFNNDLPLNHNNESALICVICGSRNPEPRIRFTSKQHHESDMLFRWYPYFFHNHKPELKHPDETILRAFRKAMTFLSEHIARVKVCVSPCVSACPVGPEDRTGVANSSFSFLSFLST